MATAKLEIKLKATTGYSEKSTFDRVTPEQWKAVNKVLHGDVEMVDSVLLFMDKYDAHKKVMK